ncbi:MAG: metallophosphoesterase [Edaphocola sp.]
MFSALRKCLLAATLAGSSVALAQTTTPGIIREPYLQVATTHSVHIRWRTDSAVGSRVRYGLAADTLTHTVTDSTSTTEHEVVLDSLTTHTKYWYTVETLTDTLQGDSSNYFMTLRAAGDTALMRIGVIGDCGNNSTNQINVRDQVLSYLGTNYMDSWILLGDNAYNTGTDAEYQAEFFNIYKDGFLKHSPLFPAPGNHDYGNSSSSASVYNHALAPYYQNFSMPTQGEAGGVASGKQAYYSFDVGNVHFLSLDSHGKEDSTTRLFDTTGAQVQWVKADLAANTNKDWVVAYWHHPPYTMGSHNSDSESELVSIRQNFVRILERMGVDLILCSHSHDYERSKLMNGHYGLESTFNATAHNISQSTGLYDGSGNSCPYVKDDSIQATGTVYVVSGSAGQLGGSQTSFPHAALSAYSDATHGGAMMLEVQGNRLDAKWICADGVIRDHFTMMKNVNFHKTYTINEGDSITLTAGFNGIYKWNGNDANTKSITVAPADTTTYIVQDTFSCVADTFELFVASSNPLPIVLQSFDVSVNNQCLAEVSWETASENNLGYFEVEFSIDGKNYDKTGTVAARNEANGATYRYSHQNPVTQGTSHYRLKSIYNNGSYQYGSVATVHTACDAAAITVWPNPVTNELHIQGLPATGSCIILHNSIGAKVATIKVSKAETVLRMENLSAGMYSLQIVDTNGKTVTTQLLMKQ